MIILLMVVISKQTTGQFSILFQLRYFKMLKGLNFFFWLKSLMVIFFPSIVHNKFSFILILYFMFLKISGKFMLFVSFFLYGKYVLCFVSF